MLAVVTDIGILEPDENGEMVLAAIHPGKSVQDARSNTGWDLKIAASLRTTEPIMPHELDILSNELDPEGIYLKNA